MSSGIIENYSESLLESSVVNQANEIEAWLEQNIASFQSAKRTIEKINPNDSELQNMLDGYMDLMIIILMEYTLQILQESL